MLTFAAGEMARDARPGHFVTIAAGGDPGPQILRRPFSFYTADPETGIASVLFSVYGPTTRAMAKLHAGETVDVIGPLGGRVFAAAEAPETHHIMVGGGYGVPPLAFLARRIKAANPKANVTIINGARSGNLLVGTDGLEERGVTVHACTNDGSVGYKGLVTELLHDFLRDRAEHTPVQVYTCGPTPMMRGGGRKGDYSRCSVSGIAGSVYALRNRYLHGLCGRATGWHVCAGLYRRAGLRGAGR